MAFDEAPITTVIVADSVLVGDGLASLFANSDLVNVVGRARGFEEMFRRLDEHAPEVVIVSIRTVDLTSAATGAVARRLRAAHPQMGILVIASTGDGFVLELLRTGAARVAFLLEQELDHVKTVLDTLQELRAGQSVLDPSMVDSLFHHRPGDR